MKILLLNPPFSAKSGSAVGGKSGKFSRTSRSPAITKSWTLYYPFWLAYATGVLEKEQFKVKLVDGPAQGINENDILNIAKGFKPDLVVIDTSTPSIYSDVKIAASIREVVQDSFVVLVGTHPSALPEETLRLSDSVDAVARGEYDYTIRDLARTLNSDRNLKSVLGLTFKD